MHPLLPWNWALLERGAQRGRHARWWIGKVPVDGSSRSISSLCRELQERVSKLLLRRTAETNAAFLPELSTYVVFCRPAQAQLARYRDILKAYHASRGGADGDALAVIQRLRQLCSHPCLERLEEAEEGRKLDQIGDPDTLSRDSGAWQKKCLKLSFLVWLTAA